MIDYVQLKKMLIAGTISPTITDTIIEMVKACEIKETKTTNNKIFQLLRIHE